MTHVPPRTTGQALSADVSPPVCSFSPCVLLREAHSGDFGEERLGVTVVRLRAEKARAETRERCAGGQLPIAVVRSIAFLVGHLARVPV